MNKEFQDGIFYEECQTKMVTRARPGGDLLLGKPFDFGVDLADVCEALPLVISLPH
jgi:hypothetical protein